MTKEVARAFVSTAAVTMPSPEERKRSSGRGGNKTVYDFGALELFKSIAVMNRTAKQLTSTISSVNNGDRKLTVKDAKGNDVMQPVKDATGAIVKGEDGKPKLEPVFRKFFAVDCDPEKDPEKAIARIWREV